MFYIYYIRFAKEADDVKLIIKIYSTVAVLLVGVLIIPILLSATVISHKAEMNEHMSTYIEKDSYKTIHIYDSSGIPIYDAGFSGDDVIRKSMFHIVGDRYGSLPNSILTQNCKEERKVSKLFGYTPKNTTINLTIDIQLQKAAYIALVNSGYNGCITIIDYSTGEIKAMVSTPTVDVFDTSYIQDKSYINKAISTYPPGSVFKAVTVAAALEINPTLKNYNYICSGTQNHIVCYGQTAHDQVDLNKALEVSCNCAVSNLAKTSLTSDMLDNYAEKFKLTGSDIVADMKISQGSIESGDDLMWAANGQSKDMFSPLSIAMFYGTIANNGVFRQLKIMQESDNSATEQIMSSYTANTLAEAMTALCKKAGIQCDAFGKTGTAQLDNQAAHAWFVCSLNDVDAPPYTIVTFLEHGEESVDAKNLTAEFINNNVLNRGA